MVRVGANGGRETQSMHCARKGKEGMSVSKGGKDGRELEGEYSVCKHIKLQGRRFT